MKKALTWLLMQLQTLLVADGVTRSAHLFFYLLRLFLAAAAAINLGQGGRNEGTIEVRQSGPVPAQ